MFCHADVSCVHPVAVRNAAFCMTGSLLMLVEDGRGILQNRSHGCSGGIIWLKPFAMVLFSVRSDVTVECCVCC